MIAIPLRTLPSSYEQSSGVPCGAEDALQFVRAAAKLNPRDEHTAGLVRYVEDWDAKVEPAPSVLAGGALVIGALVFNELLALRGRRTAVADTAVPGAH